MNGFEHLPTMTTIGRMEIGNAVLHSDDHRVVLRAMQLPANSRQRNAGHIVKVGYRADNAGHRQVWLQVFRVRGMHRAARTEIEARLTALTKFFEANGVAVSIQRSFNPMLEGQT